MPNEDKKLPLEEARDTLFALNHLPIPPLTAEQVIERGLLLAKRSPTDREMVRAAVFYHYSGFAVGSMGKHFEDHLPLETAQHWWAENESHRNRFRERLADLSQQPQKAINASKSELQQLDWELLIAAGIDHETGEITHRFFPLTVEAGYMYVLQGLCSKERWKRLRQCRFDGCGAFFYRKPSLAGGRPRVYCTQDCQLKSDRENALARQKKQRLRTRALKRGEI